MSLRWMAEIIYRPSPHGCHVECTICFEEISDLEDIVERGPDWNEIDHITITLNRPSLTPRQETIGSVK